jgi:MOSC domain-containing protein
VLFPVSREREAFLIMPFLEGIFLYPIKSLNGISVSKAEITKNGGLEHDREFAMIGQDGKFINGKRNSKVHLLRSSFNSNFSFVKIHNKTSEDERNFHLVNDRPLFEEWLSGFFGTTIHIEQNESGGFPDDTDSPGPTVAGRESLREVSHWFPPLMAEDIRARFRPNLILGDAPVFWEDRLFGEQDDTVHFQIGNVYLDGINPCQRCVVPTRNPESGDVYPDFQKKFMEHRERSLPSWSPRSRFSHFYRFSVNTRIFPSEKGKVLTVGDEVRILV